MTQDRKAAIKKLKNLVISPKQEVESFRQKIEETFASSFIPCRVENNPREYGGVKCDVLVPEVYTSSRIVLYIHGGSFAAGSRESWRPFCAQLANASSCRVVVPEFRLPPSHPFPAGLDDVNAVFRMIYAEEEVNLRLSKKEGENSGNVEIVIASDSSGASLAMALVFKLDEKYRKSVRDVVLLSPWLDLTDENPIAQSKKFKDEILSWENVHRAVELYTYYSNVSNSLVSPLKAEAENFINFPSVYIQIGEKEFFKAQSELLKTRLTACGIECVIDECENMMSMFQFADEYLSESHLAIERLGKYICRRNGISEDEREERKKIMDINNIFQG